MSGRQERELDVDLDFSDILWIYARETYATRFEIWVNPRVSEIQTGQTLNSFVEKGNEMKRYSYN